MRVALAGVGLLALLAATPSLGASPTQTVPLAGDWEGTGPHGLPLSFSLVRDHGRLVATSLAVGYPASCPAATRDAEAVPLTRPSYAGPGATSDGSTGAATLSGRIPRSGQFVVLQGGWTSTDTGAFSVPIQKRLGCGWPGRTLNWTVHSARRLRVDDGTWTGPLTATGLINGNVRLVVGGEGRVIDSFTSFFTCLTDTQQGNTNFRAVPVFEFVRPRGSFLSPLDGGRVRGRRTTWAGRFLGSRRVAGTLTIFDDCTNRLIRAHFAAAPSGTG